MHRPHPSDAPEGRCSSCRKPCVAVALDIDPEAPKWVWASPCCEAEVEPEEDEPVRVRVADYPPWLDFHLLP